MANIFKAYDIRGVYPEEINKEIAYKIGTATAKFIQSKSSKKKMTLVVGEDCRLASPELRGAVIDAITKAGANVYYIGICTTPLFYFSVNKSGADGGIMVTASHNPPQYGGLKIVGFESRPIGELTGLREIEKIVMENQAPDLEIKPGAVEEKDYVNDYINFLIKESRIVSDHNLSGQKKLKIVIDASNGMKPVVINPLMKKLNLAFSPLYFKIDCTFPNHSSDISKEEALDDLRKKVKEENADLGIAFDGDGDRIMFVDEKGEIIRADYILALLFKSKSGFFHKPKTVYDIRVSRSVKELLGSKGIKSRPGHSFIKRVMRDNKAELGGELSGHLFFKEAHYTEASALVMLKVMKILQDSGSTMSELIKPFQKYFHSGEVNMEIPSREKGVDIMTKLKDQYKEGSLDETDGITIEYPDWWFNVRLSNTEPIIRLVVETNTQVSMMNKREELSQAIKRIAREL
jgi:phosphomannomutase